MLFDIFNKKDTDKLEIFLNNLHSQITNDHTKWMALAINDRAWKNSLLTKEAVFYSESKNKFKANIIRLADSNSGIFVNSQIDKKIIFDHSVSNNYPIKSKFKNLIEGHILKEFEIFKTQLNKGEFSPLQAENEEKALEWIRVSFEVLKKAIIESITNEDFLFQCKIFAGTNPQTKQKEIRIITFNLDITLILLENNNLRVIIYNNKPGIDPKTIKPSLIGDYSLRKREIFDHIIDLFSLLTKAIEA